MNRHLLLALVVTLSPLAAHAAEQPPNVVVILSDDYGYGSAGCYGANPALVQTPNIDRLAKEGRRFTDANTTSSVCSPTRYSLMTGRYCWRTSLKHEVLSTFAPLHIEPTRLNMASLLKKHGYATASVGKWHLGYGTADDSPKWRTDYTAELSPGPLDIGFDYHFSVPSNHGDVTGVFVENRFVYGLRNGKIPDSMKTLKPVSDTDEDFQKTYGPEDMENPGKGAKVLDLDAPRRKNQRVMKVLTDKATAWMQQQPKDKPFFLYFTPVAVHMPVTPDKDIAGQSKGGLYCDWITELDRSVGRVLDTLDKMGVAKNTLVIFSSDNGGVKELAREDLLQTKAWNAGLAVNGALRGGKHHVWEGGFKVPFIVRWPGKAAPGSVSNEMISIADILATTAAVVGEKLPPAATAAEDSHSFLPAILGDPAKPIREDMIVHSADGVFAIRKGPWKWIEGVPVDEIKAGARKAHADEYHEQLYNTHDDPTETKDVSAEHPEIVTELRALLNRYRNGGYSRELPPADVKPVTTKLIVLPPQTGTVVLNESLAAQPSKPWTASTGEWQPRGGALWGGQKGKEDQAAVLRTPLAITDGSVDFELNFQGANRMSLRVETSDKKGSFRVVISRTALEFTKNPSQGESKDAMEPLARKPLKLEAGTWYPVRITFKGNEAIAQVNDTIAKGTHAVLGEKKTGANFLVFGESVGLRNVKVTQ
ncbi:MAG: arylsulfatase [Chthoniobacteraceae bacterium]